MPFFFPYNVAKKAPSSFRCFHFFYCSGAKNAMTTLLPLFFFLQRNKEGDSNNAIIAFFLFLAT
jgi:hypothetical protein